MPGFKFKYSLYVDGKPYEQYKNRQATVLKAWEIEVKDKPYRIVLGKYEITIIINLKKKQLLRFRKRYIKYFP